MKQVFWSLLTLAALAMPAQSQDKPFETKPVAKAYARGHKEPVTPAEKAAREARHDEAFKRHGAHVNHLRLRATIPDAFDCRTALKNVLPMDDQGQCGDCFGVSTADACSMALVLCGTLPLDGSKGRLSSQYGLDNSSAFQGGCNGGDEAQVIDFVKKHGFPLTSDYGPYTASPGRLKPVGAVYKVKDWGYCTANQQGGVASTADIQACMMKYGPISVAFDASACNSYVAGSVMRGNGTSVDHAVLCVGWKTVGGKVIFLGMNQWGTSWGDGGFFWIEEGSYSWGTEAIWVLGGDLPLPVPTPTPPTPPSPNGVTVVGLTLKYSDGSSADMKVVAADAETITGDMSIRDLTDALDRIRKKSAKPCCLPPQAPPVDPRIEARLDANERTMAAIVTVLEKLQKQLEK